MSLNRIELLRKKYPNVADVVIQNITKEHNKYMLWMAIQLDKGHNLPDVLGTIDFFHRNSTKLAHKDIYQYDDLKVLENEIKDIGESKRRAKADGKDCGSVIVFENDLMKVVRLNSWNAVAEYGKGSRWCITQADSTYWEDYSLEKNIFYIAVMKDKKYFADRNVEDENCEKICIQKERGYNLTVWWQDDTDIELCYFLEDHPEFEEVVVAILGDKDPNIIAQIATVDNSVLEPWLLTQHKKTIKWLQSKFTKRLANTYLGVSLEIVSKMGKKDLQNMWNSNPQIILDHLSKVKESKKFVKFKRVLKAVLPEEHTADIVIVKKPKKVREPTDQDKFYALCGSGSFRANWKEYLSSSSESQIFKAYAESKYNAPKSERVKALKKILLDRLSIESVIEVLSDLRYYINDPTINNMFKEQNENS